MTQPSTVTRRTLTRGVAWSIPTVAVGSAAPALAASGCVACAQPLAGGGGSTTVVSGGSGTLALAGTFTTTLTGCTGLISAGVVTTHKATLTMSDGRTYTTTANLGAGPHVAGVAQLGSGIAFSSVRFPNGVYASAGGIGSLPVYPTRLCFDLSIPLGIGGTTISCSQTVCFAPSFLNANLGTVILGAGSITYGTVWQGG